MSFGNWVNGVFIEQAFSEDLNNLFFNEFFTIMILADVFILLMSFQYTERYSQLIRNTGFIISTILLRLSFSVSGLTSILLIISGIVFGLIILLIYNLIERDKKTLS
jgi:NADH:ubiquinone oxidoreductase subunit 4 (subunit M)